jgi:tetratricopeptide (TPR) repeat protein
MPDDVKEYAQRANRLRSEGRLDESILVARRAITIDANDANAWWQLALSLREKDGAKAALPALARVCELAPDFLHGWHELGLAHHAQGNIDEAAQAYERALAEDDEHIPSMRMLAFALRGKDEEGAKARRLTLLRTIAERRSLNEAETFDLAYLLGEARETAEAARVYERYTREHGGQAAFFNLALAYRTLGRDIDAVDALQAARKAGYSADKCDALMAILEEPLRALRQMVLSKQQPYLPQADWYQHYVNPYSLLNVKPDEVEGNQKALQKARQALLREIELEDGKVDWLPGLVTDKSAAMAILAELDIEESVLAHRVVLENPSLNDFLMRGNLEHFLLTADGLIESRLPHLLDEPLLERIGPKFAAQFDHMLSRAAERGDLQVVECLLDGRSWTTPAQHDACYASTRRLLSRMREPLEKLSEEAEGRPVSVTEVREAFDHDGLSALLPLLPGEFHEDHRAVCNALRELSVSHFNRELDAEPAKTILVMARFCAEKSPALAHQLEEDQKTLDAFLAEERKHEAHLTFGDRHVSITKAGVVNGRQALAPTDIIGVRWGRVQTAVHPLTIRFTVGFRARQGEDITISWTTSNDLERQQQLWGGLVDATTAYVFDSVEADFQRQLKSGSFVRVGPIEVRKEGVVLTAKGWFTSKDILVPWSRLSSTILNGSVVLRDIANRKATAELPVETTYNAFLMHIFANRKDSARP